VRELCPVLPRSFPFVRIDGTMSLKKRAEVVQQFHNDPEACTLYIWPLNATCSSSVDVFVSYC
jgi:SNF2 family DNA or RNA helicase